MNDPLENLDSEVSVAPPWSPSARLQEHLLAGVLASLFWGILSIAGLLAELTQPKVAGWTLADNFYWAALLPLGLVLRTYLALGREVESFALTKSACCLFGVIFLVQIFDLATKEALLLGWRVAAWTIFGIGAMALFGGLFVTGPQPDKPAGQPAAESTAKRSAGVLGSLGVALAVIVKLAGKGLIAKFWLFHLVARLVRNLHDDLTPLVAIVLLVMAVAFLIWFAVCKIRLRDKLGGAAVRAGWAEILGFACCLGVAAWIMIETSIALAQPGLNEQAQNQVLEDKGRQFALLGIGAVCLWTGVTALFFQTLRQGSDSGEMALKDDAAQET